MVSRNNKPNRRRRNEQRERKRYFADIQGDWQWFEIRPDKWECCRPLGFLERLTRGLPPSTLVYLPDFADGIEVLRIKPKEH
jgi:hypothetical protein